MKPKVLINKGRQRSSGTNLNYFAKMGHIYIMDNHLAAIWCWDRVPKDLKFAILHIDAHDDLGDSPPWEFIYGKIDLTKIPIDEIVSYQDARNCQYFLWDNYIHLFNDKYPKLINKLLFMTHNHVSKSRLPGVEIENFDILQLDSIPWNQPNNRKILNLDIDYFFSQDNNIKNEFLNHDQIDYFSDWLMKNKDNFDQITIALSPECCGSWENSINMANRILKPLEISIEI